MATITVPSAETILSRLNIDYRKIAIKSGIIYFCSLLNKSTFDLLVDNDGMIKLWCFVGECSPARAGTCYEYRSPKLPDAAIGLEVTEEGDISFYAEASLGEGFFQHENLIYRVIDGYTTTISEFDTKSVNCKPAMYRFSNNHSLKLGYVLSCLT